jgi:hypothetical protein
MTQENLTHLVVRVYPGEDGSDNRSTLYEDDGVTEKYTQGESASTDLRYIRAGNQTDLIIGPTLGRFAGQNPQRSYTLEFYNATQPQSVWDDGHNTYTYDPNLKILRVEVPAKSIAEATLVKITY